MSFIDRIDPELVHAVDLMPAERYIAFWQDPPKARQMTEDFKRAQMAALPPSDVTIEERSIPGKDGDVPIVIYQPTNPAPRGGLLWLHGGGYVVGTARDDGHGIGFAQHVGCAVVSVDYRLAPEFTYKESVADAFTALTWMADHAADLGIDRERIAIGGGSAGGGLAAGLALYNRDQQGPPLKLQLLVYPMIDDTHETPSGREITHPTVWHRKVSFEAWKMYLGDEYGRDSVSPYAAAARAKDLSGLPPAFVTVGMLDLFRDENIDYAQRLMAAGVAADLRVYPGMFHGAEMSAPDAAVSRRMRTDYRDAVKRAIG